MTSQKAKAIEEFNESVAELGQAPTSFLGQVKYMNSLMEIIGVLYDKGFNEGYSEKVISETKDK